MNLVKVDNTFKGEVNNKVFNLDITLQKEMEFKENINKKFPGKYDLSFTEYKNIQTPVNIKCLEHNIMFTQTPRNLLDGLCGCKLCYRDKYSKDQNDFIEEAKNVHGNKYGYENVKYIKSDIPVDITCPIHGIFQQRPMNHLRGQNCKKCVDEKRKIHETYTLNVNADIEKLKTVFINKSINKYGRIYNYDKVDYKGLDTLVTITCPIHGDFEVTPHTHLRPSSNGCTKCYNNRTEKKEEYIKKAREKHGDKFGYEELDMNLEKNNFYCREHGKIFQQETRNHLRYNGCPDCIKKNLSLSQEEFIKRGILKHGDKITYDKVNLIKLDIPVILTCKEHGDFEKLPYDFIRPFIKDGDNNGCPVCSSSKGEQEVFKILRDLEIDFIREYKIPNFNYRYDFYIPNINVLIEYHGEQHYKSNNFYNYDKKNDIIKADLGKTYKYDILNISYKDKDVKKTIVDFLKNYIRFKYKGEVFFSKKNLLNKLPPNEDYTKYRYNLTIKK